VIIKKETKITDSYSSFIHYNDDIKLYHLVGCQLTTIQEKGSGIVTYKNKRVIICTGSKEKCIELDKRMFPEKYF